jgi:hypothetical protein
MRAGVGRVWIASCAVLTCMGALSAACSTRGTSDVARSVSSADVDAQPHQSDGAGSDVASVVGTWEFAALTGVPPAELPPGSIPDNRRDLVIGNDGSFRWGTWFGTSTVRVRTLIRSSHGRPAFGNASTTSARV